MFSGAVRAVFEEATMSDADAANFRRIPLEVFNQGRLDLIDELLAPDFVEHATLPPGLPEGRDGLRAIVSAIRGAFPDFRYEIVLQLQDGDTHVGYIRATGTMTGDFMGMPATGKTATWDEAHIGRYRDGTLVEHWAVQDQLGMLQQLGLASGPEAG
jgi:predicted ester cyclase